jgi:hypothetical protein
MKRPLFTIKLVSPNDPRGWIGIGCYLLVLILLGMMWADKSLLRDDFFKVIATAIILTGWNQGPVGWAYQATKGGGELADKNAEIIKQRAAVDAALPPNGEPQEVEVVNSRDAPVPVDSKP